MRLLLHIGTEKTGTTSIQRSIADNCDALAAQGVGTSAVLGEAYHTSLLGLPVGDRHEVFARRGISSEEDQTAYRDRLFKTLAQDVDTAREHGAHSFILSDELCHSRLTDPMALQRMAERLSTVFREMQVICYLRPQVDMAVSHASTLARLGRKITASHFDTVLKPSNSYYDYDGLIARWETAFGSSSISLVAYRDLSCSTEPVYAALGVDPSGFIPPARSNEALDIGTLALLNMYGGPTMLPGMRRSPLARFPLARLPVTETLSLGLETAQALQARFDAQNRALTQRRADISEDDLALDLAHHSRPSNLDLLEPDQRIARQITALIQELNRDRFLADLRQLLGAVERALANRNPAGLAARMNRLDNQLSLVDGIGLPEADRNRIAARGQRAQRRYSQFVKSRGGDAAPGGAP